MEFLAGPYRIRIDECRFMWLCRMLGVPWRLVPSLWVGTLCAPRNPLDRHIARYVPATNRIEFFPEPLGEGLSLLDERDRAPQLAGVVVHELAHFLCLRMDHYSFWGIVHNSAHAVVRFVTPFTPVAPEGPERLGLTWWWFWHGIREHAAERLTRRIIAAHAEMLAGLVRVSD